MCVVLFWWKHKNERDVLDLIKLENINIMEEWADEKLELIDGNLASLNLEDDDNIGLDDDDDNGGDCDENILVNISYFDHYLFYEDEWICFKQLNLEILSIF